MNPLKPVTRNNNDKRCNKLVKFNNVIGNITYYVGYI